MNPAVRAFDLHPPPVSAARTSAFGWVIALSEASKKLVTHSFQVNLLALAAIVQSRRAGQSLRGFDEVASQMRRWSVDLHTELEKLRGIGREAVSLASQLTKAARLVDILERARGTRADTALERALERRRHSVEELDARIAGARRRLIGCVDDLCQLGLMATVLSRSAMIEAATASPLLREQLSQVSREFYTNADWVIGELQRLQKVLR